MTSSIKVNMKNRFFSPAFMIMLIPLLIALTTMAQPPAPVYVSTISKCYGGSGSEEFFGAVRSMNGGFILSGLTNSYDGDVNQPVVYDTANIFVVKADAQGNKIWARAYGGNAYDKARFAFEDSDSNIVVIGTTQSIDGDITFSHGNSEMFVMKLNPAGDILWFKNYGGSGFESGRFGSQLADGNYLIGGYSASNDFDVPFTRGDHDGWLLKIDTAGTIIWSQTYGGSQSERLRYFVEMSDGSIYFTGASSSNDFQCSGNHGGDDFWVGKTDANGNLLWNKQFGGSLADAGYGITAISGNRFILSGNTASSDGDVVGYKGGTTDGWVVMIDSSGNLLGQSCLGGTRGDRLYNTIEYAPDKFYAAGFTSSNDVDLAGTNAGPSNEYWLVSLDNLMQPEWSVVTGGNARDLGTELIYDPADSSVVIIGDSNSSNGNVVGNHGDADFWMVKLSLFTSLPEIASAEPITAYLEPGTGTLVISTHDTFTSEVLIADLSGKIVQEIPATLFIPGRNRVALSEAVTTTKGIYLVSIPDAPASFATKIATGFGR